MNPTWPDLVIALIVLVFALRGWKRGFVRELAGVVAIGAALVAAFHYPGTLDESVASIAHLQPGPAHIVAMVVFALAAYAAVMAVAFIFERFARLPIVSFGNAVVGALVGAAKALVLMWALLYVALFVRMPRDIRQDLRHSFAVELLTRPNTSADATLQAAVPAFAQAYVAPVFRNHHL